MMLQQTCPCLFKFLTILIKLCENKAEKIIQNEFDYNNSFLFNLTLVFSI